MLYVDHGMTAWSPIDVELTLTRNILVAFYDSIHGLVQMTSVLPSDKVSV
jgi:hypothetical protein